MTECACGRPLATAADLARWRDEVGDRRTDDGLLYPGPMAVALGRSLGGHSLPAEPLWAMALCWTVRALHCNMRRRWASDRWIAEARHVFAAYILASPLQ